MSEQDTWRLKFWEETRFAGRWMDTQDQTVSTIDPTCRLDILMNSYHMCMIKAATCETRPNFIMLQTYIYHRMFGWSLCVCLLESIIGSIQMTCKCGWIFWLESELGQALTEAALPEAAAASLLSGGVVRASLLPWTQDQYLTWTQTNELTITRYTDHTAPSKGHSKHTTTSVVSANNTIGWYHM